MPLDSPHLTKGQLYRVVVTTSNQPSLHPMISQRRKRKVRVFLSTDSFKQAMVDTVEDGSISFDSGIKQGNARYTHLRDVHDQKQIVNDDEVQEMLNDEVQGSRLSKYRQSGSSNC